MRPLQTKAVLLAWGSTKSITLEPKRDKSLPRPDWFYGKRETLNEHRAPNYRSPDKSNEALQLQHCRYLSPTRRVRSIPQSPISTPPKTFGAGFFRIRCQPLATYR